MTKSLAKTLIIFGIILFATLMLIGIIQSFKLNSLAAAQREANERSAQMERSLNKLDEELEYKNSPAYSHDYFEQEEKYGKTNDKIYKAE